jgi:hypothetical protein
LVSQSFIVLSSLPEPINFASGENLTVFTQFVCEDSVHISFRSAMDTTLTVLSSEPVAISLSSQEKSTLLTGAELCLKT